MKRWLTILDRYIIYKFLGTFFLIMAAIMLVVIVFDLSENIDEFVNARASVQTVAFKYYLNFIPFFFSMFSGLFTFIAVIFYTSRLAANTEVIAMLSGGVTYKRFLRPFIIAASFLMLISLVLGHYIIPIANAERQEFIRRVKNKQYIVEHNIHRQLGKGWYLYMKDYDPHTDMGYQFTLERFNNNKLIEKLDAGYVQWDATIQKWKTGPYSIRIFNNNSERFVSGESKMLTLPTSPNDYKRRNHDAEMLTTPLLTMRIKALKLQGVNETSFLIEKYKRTSMSFAILVLTVLGVSLSSRKSRGGIGVKLGVGLMLSFAYVFCLHIYTLSAAATAQTTLQLLYAAWAPNIIFGIIALIAYYRAANYR